LRYWETASNLRLTFNQQHKILNKFKKN